MLTADVLKRLDRMERVGDLLDLVAARTAPLGYSVFAIGAPHRNGDFAGYFYATWPEDWIETYIAEGLTEHDPMQAAARVNLLPFRWSDMMAGRAGIVPTAENHRAYATGVARGYVEGVCVPIHGPGAYLALASYAGRAPDTSDAAMADLHLLTLHAHVRLATLHARQPAALAEETDTTLSAREVAALACVFAGLTDAGVGQKLGVSERTARFHIDNARRKLGAKTRAQAVATALALGLLAP